MNSGTSNTRLSDMLTEFTDYVFSFYGDKKEALYPLFNVDTDKQVDKQDILSATYDYLQAIDEYDEDVVSAFLDIFDIDSIGSLSDAYQGKYTDGAEFAESIVSECYSMEMPSWVEVDWQATWDNALSYDYSESDGHIFNNNF